MKFEREKIMNGIGFLLLASCFAYSLFKISTRAARESDDSVTTIRFAHWQLEAGIKDALDAVVKEYTRQHPTVKVEQILIPERVYSTWLTTRLVGGNPPDLVSTVISNGMTEDRMARYFIPLTSEVEKPNPYNKGTELEQLPWRDTFIDGLATAPGILNLFDYYGVPSSVTTIRLFYNETLYKEITGKTTPPATYEDLKSVFAAVKEYNKKNNTNLVTIAGSKYNGPIIMDILATIETQKLMLKLDHFRIMRQLTAPFTSYYDGDFSPDDEAIIASLKLTREIGQEMPQGFTSLAREDSTFSFIQKKSLMIATGTWDVKSLRQEADFTVSVIPIPFPLRSDPQYGSYLLGQPAEAENGSSVHFGISRDSKHPEVALDFLKFLTSQPGNRIFSEKSNWLPSVVGVPIPPSVEAFKPIQEGYPAGFSLKGTGGGEVNRIYENAFQRLVRPDGSVQAFMDYFKPQYATAMITDTKLHLKNSMRNISRQDTILSALTALAQEGDQRSYLKANTLKEVQSSLELEYYQRRYSLWNFEHSGKGH